MKLNDITLNESRWFGDYGSAVMQNLSNKLAGSGEGSMSTLDKMTKNQYINNFVGLASTNLESAIESTRVDPNATSQPASQPATQPTTQPSAQQPATTGTGATAQAAPKSPEEIRKAKQATAAKTAQGQMAANPVPAKPAPIAQQTPAQIRQQKQAAATQAAQANMAPVSKLPANQPQIQAQNIRQKKQATATATANQQAAPFSKVSPAPAVWKNNRKPGAAATRRPMAESVIMEAGMSISDFMQQFVKKQLQGLDIGSEQAKIKELADKVQATYKQDGGKAAITQIANLAFSLEHAGGGASTEPATEPQASKASNPFSAGMDAAMGKPTSTTTATSTSTSTPAAATTTPAAAQKEQTVYMQVKGMLDKLDKKGKQRILAALEKSLGSATPTASTSSSTANDPGAMAFAQMGKQVTQPGVTNPSASTKTSTGGKTQQTGLGQVHTKSRANPNIKRRTKPAVAPATTPAPAQQWKGRKKVAAPVTESKKPVKIWGQK